MDAAADRDEDRRVAALLLDHADLLERQGGDPFRARAWRAAGDAIPGFARPLREVLNEEGRDGLIALPTIGIGIAAAIDEILTTGHWARHDRLRGDARPEALFATVPGIGPILARRLTDEHHLESLEDLESALHDPDIHIDGVGRRRRAALIAALAQRLGRMRPARQGRREPDVALLLKVDAAYRAGVAAGSLPLIAPRRFNPEREAWLPILHMQQDGWQFTALHSNTATAHRLGRIWDWVAIYFEDDRGAQGRSTVVTETRGPLAGQRVVRGREGECAALHPRAPRA